MQVVVEINDKLYKRLFDNGVDNYDDAVDMAKAIRKGTPLPKCHGRLIDADKLKAELKEHHDFYVNTYGGFRNLPINDKSRVDEITGSIASVVNSKTIIEADKAEVEPQESEDRE